MPPTTIGGRFDPRRLLTAGGVVAALGSILFTMAPSASMAGLGRLLAGGSVAVAFVGILKLAGHWLPHRLYAIASGLALLTGIAGAGNSSPCRAFHRQNVVGS